MSGSLSHEAVQVLQAAPFSYTGQLSGRAGIKEPGLFLYPTVIYIAKIQLITDCPMWHCEYQISANWVHNFMKPCPMPGPQSKAVDVRGLYRISGSFLFIFLFSLGQGFLIWMDPDSVRRP